ncbi:MAG: hypothetical protein ABH880_00440 [Patescibacteria group bacterium]
MLSIEECNKYLGDVELTDEQVESLRDSLYVLVEKILDSHINGSIKKIDD